MGTGVSDGLALGTDDGFALSLGMTSSVALGSGVPLGLRNPADPASMPYRTMPTNVATTPIT